MDTLASKNRISTVELLLVGILIAAFGLGPLAGCGGPADTGTQKTGESAVSVKTSTTQRGTIQAQLSFTGDIKANSQVAIVPQLGARLDKLNVDIGSVVKAGDIIGEQDHSIQDAQLRQAQGNLAAAQARFATLKDGPRAEVVAQAEANLAAAQAQLAQIKAGPTAAQIKAAEAQLRLAQNQLYSVQTQADAMLGSRAVIMGTAVYTKDMKEAASGVAYEQVQAAQAQLDGLMAPPQPEIVAQAEAAVQAADQQLKLAQNPYTQHDIETAQAQVTIAQAAVDLAQAQINQMIIKSPVDGVVSDKLVSQGALVGPTTPLVNIISTDVEIVVPIDQDQVQQIAIGQAVTCTMKNGQGEAITGTISMISPAGDARSRSFSARIKPNDPQQKLKPGMFVQVQIETGEKTNTLIVPQAAIVEKNGEPFVFVTSNGTAIIKKVTTGVSDGTNIEIIDGLNENDTIIISGLNGLADGDKVIIAEK